MAKTFKIYRKRKLDETAEEPLLNPEMEIHRLRSIVKQKEEEKETEKEEKLKQIWKTGG